MNLDQVFGEPTMAHYSKSNIHAIALVRQLRDVGVATYRHDCEVRGHRRVVIEVGRETNPHRKSDGAMLRRG